MSDQTTNNLDFLQSDEFLLKCCLDEATSVIQTRLSEWLKAETITAEQYERLSKARLELTLHPDV